MDITRTRILLAALPAADWAQANPVLGLGEPAFETDTGFLRIGDGTSRFLELKVHGAYDEITDAIAAATAAQAAAELARDETAASRVAAEAAADTAGQARDAAQQVATDLGDLDGAIAAAEDARQGAEANRVLSAEARLGAETARDGAELAAATAQAAARSFATWSALAAETGSTPGEGCEVMNDDTGTHVDPVSGNTVPNAGRYAWSADPAGWARIGDTLRDQVATHLGQASADEDGGRPLMLDAARNVLLRKDPDGLTFIPSTALVDRLAARLPDTGGDTEALAEAIDALQAAPVFSTIGRALLMTENDGVLLAKRADGLDFIPSAALAKRLRAPREDAPAEAIYVRGEGPTLEYGLLNEDGLVESFIRLPQADDVPFTKRRFQLLSVTGQSLAVAGPFSDVSEVPDLDDRPDVFILGGLETETGIPAYIRGFGNTPADYTLDATGLEKFTYAAHATDKITSAGGIARSLNRHRRRTRLSTCPILAVCHGASGIPWERLDNDPTTDVGGDDPTQTHMFANMTYWHEQAKQVLDGLGFDCILPWHVIVHGTSASFDPPGAYHGFLDAYLRDFRQMLDTVGIAGEARFVLTQSGGRANNSADNRDWENILDQLRFCQEGKAVLAGPLYPYEIHDNNVHPDARHTVLFNEVIARAMSEVDAGRGWTTLGPIDHRLEGNTITLRFDTRPDERLTTHDPAKYGGEGIDTFLGFETEGATITAVRVFQDYVEIDCDGPPSQLQYAMQVQDVTGFADNRYTAHRGLLRSTWSFPSEWYPDTLYRWVPSFRIQL